MHSFCVFLRTALNSKYPAQPHFCCVGLSFTYFTPAKSTIHYQYENAQEIRKLNIYDALSYPFLALLLQLSNGLFAQCGLLMFP